MQRSPIEQFVTLLLRILKHHCYTFVLYKSKCVAAIAGADSGSPYQTHTYVSIIAYICIILRT